MQMDMERRQALAKLLAQPDDPSLQRGHRVLQHGRPDRHEMLPYLAAAYVQSKLLELREREVALCPAVG